MMRQPRGKTLIRRGMNYQEALLKYLSDEHKHRGQPFELAKWTLPAEPTVKVPLQEATNTHDCGVYICVYAEHFSRYAENLITNKGSICTEENMPRLRERLALAVLDCNTDDWGSDVWKKGKQ